MSDLLDLIIFCYKSICFLSRKSILSVESVHTYYINLAQHCFINYFIVMPSKFTTDFVKM